MPSQVKPHNGYIDINSKVNCMFWVQKTPKNKSYTTSANNTYHLYTYDILDKTGKVSTPIFNGWKLLSVTDYDWKSSTSGTKLEIADPFGEIKVRKTNKHDEYAVSEAISYLESISNHANWYSLELEEKLEELQKKMESKRNIYTHIIKERQALINTAFYKSIMKFHMDTKNNSGLSDEEKKENIFNILKDKGLDNAFYNEWIINKTINDYYWKELLV